MQAEACITCHRGGLAETIRDGSTGLLFDEYTPERLDWTIDRAVVRFSHTDAWQEMIHHAMVRDFSWGWVVGQYCEVYDRAFQLREDATEPSPAP